MTRFAYLGVLAFVVVGTAWLEVALRVRVYRRWRRLALSVAPVVVVFVLWDVYAIAQGHWTFDPDRTTGVLLPGRLPLDELLFFVVIPLAAVLTLEAVRSVRRWEVGDEPPGACASGVRESDGDGADETDAATGRLRATRQSADDPTPRRAAGPGEEA